MRAPSAQAMRVPMRMRRCLGLPKHVRDTTFSVAAFASFACLLRRPRCDSAFCDCCSLLLLLLSIALVASRLLLRRLFVRVSQSMVCEASNRRPAFRQSSATRGSAHCSGVPSGK